MVYEGLTKKKTHLDNIPATVQHWETHVQSDYNKTSVDATSSLGLNQSWRGISVLTLKHRETHGCVVSTVATDALVLKHQAISTHNAD